MNTRKDDTELVYKAQAINFFESFRITHSNDSLFSFSKLRIQINNFLISVNPC
jgi:hypothetical protein